MVTSHSRDSGTSPCIAPGAQGGPGGNSPAAQATGRLATLDDLQPGVRLARPATTRNGLVLVPAGTVVTQSLIAKLKAWAVLEVFVEAPAEDQQAASRPPAGTPNLDARRDLLRSRLARNPPSAFLDAVLDAVLLTEDPAAW